ncbi:nuclear poly(A) polymerase 3 isoform X2 [Arabidopsis lyrata subsp. lyrata]|uniref:nuclear poly(A) polymerase 3 isoform X2 n=1 Tax=Arabidopsis lyrata subsp. lyrata TaxID=81972 RepID=UPI000A29ABC4|nr:nuclear poly(A) polymerase 3 isoform X2 [Arabidopsis lyrata subsp. lyrata]|eukprot:XP_020887452.1 nuclear poly(A) polymerase 3 isoform X2 [Arabidopsis lyrata subsp. lyrata]
MKKGGGRNKGFPPSMEDGSSISLRQLMVNEGLIPSLEDQEKRRVVINKLRKVYGSESDIDALCIGPFFASISEDFFISLRDMLKSRREVSEVHCVKDAKVPLIRFKFDGILVDLPYAQLRVLSIPNNVDVLNPFFLRDIDETSWKSLSGVRANKCILQLVPSLELFQSLLRCVKLWAKRRGVYGNLNGFLGGVHMAILAAFVCGYESNATLSSLLANFFYIFAHWQWPTPVVLLEDTYPATGAPPGLMPIQLPCGSHQYCNSNITRSTFYKIMAEFLRGHNLTKDYLKPNFSWKNLFELYPYENTYTWFTKIHLSAANQEDLSDWVGWVKSRFRCLLSKIEEVYGICDPNPTEYVETYTKQPNIVFYWGLQLRTINVSDIESVETEFLKNLNSGSFQGPVGRIQLSVVKESQLPKNGECASNNRSKKVTKTCWRIRENKQCNNVPVYSHHLPGYVVGYQKMANREADGMAG